MDNEGNQRRGGRENPDNHWKPINGRGVFKSQNREDGIGERSEYKGGRGEYRGGRGEYRGGRGEYRGDVGEYRGGRGEYRRGRGESREGRSEYRERADGEERVENFGDQTRKVRRLNEPMELEQDQELSAFINRKCEKAKFLCDIVTRFKRPKGDQNSMLIQIRKQLENGYPKIKDNSMQLYVNQTLAAINEVLSLYCSSNEPSQFQPQPSSQRQLIPPPEIQQQQSSQSDASSDNDDRGGRSEYKGGRGYYREGRGYYREGRGEYRGCRGEYRGERNEHRERGDGEERVERGEGQFQGQNRSENGGGDGVEIAQQGDQRGGHVYHSDYRGHHGGGGYRGKGDQRHYENREDHDGYRSHHHRGGHLGNELGRLQRPINNSEEFDGNHRHRGSQFSNSNNRGGYRQNESFSQIQSDVVKLSQEDRMNILMGKAGTIMEQVAGAGFMNEHQVQKLNTFAGKIRYNLRKILFGNLMDRLQATLGDVERTLSQYQVKQPSELEREQEFSAFINRKCEKAKFLCDVVIRFKGPKGDQKSMLICILKQLENGYPKIIDNSLQLQVNQTMAAINEVLSLYCSSNNEPSQFQQQPQPSKQPQPQQQHSPQIQQQQSQQSDPSADNDDEEALCKICLINKKTYTAIPCGHFIYCGECKAMVKKQCLLCRQPVDLMIKIFG